MNRNSVIAMMATIIIVAFKSVSNGADRKYQIVDLGTFGGEYSFVKDINASGQVVGYATTLYEKSRAFIWYKGSMQDLGTLGGDSSYASGINDNNQVVGWSVNNNWSDHAFLYSNGLMQDLGTLGGNYSYAYDINNKGQIIGDTIDSNRVFHDFLYSNGLMQDINGLFGGAINLTGINNLGDITGFSGYPAAFLYINGIMKSIPAYLGHSCSINDSGQVVGYFINSDNVHAYIYDGTLKDLGTLGGKSAWGYGINSMGEVVGDSDGNAFIYSNGKMSDLSRLIINKNGWTIAGAIRINDAGQIIGNGCNPSGQQHGFLLNPIPMEPIQTISNITPAQLTFGVCPIKDPTKDSLVLITHGWQPNAGVLNGAKNLLLGSPDITFIYSMSTNINNDLVSHEINNWQVFGYNWFTNAWVFSADDALNNAKQEGRHLGKNIVAQGWTHVHFIAHSAGAALIQAATEVIKDANNNIVVHETFLDPFVGSDFGGVYTYGRRADWADQYFSRDGETIWDPFSNIFKFAPYTQSSAFHSYNVDVTFLDPHKTSYNKFSSTPNGVQITETCTKYSKTTHGWSVDFYMNTITNNNISSYAGLGFSLSEEGGNWNEVLGYSVGNGTEFNPSEPVRVLDTNLLCTAVTQKTSPYSDFIPDFTQAPIIQSATGIIQKYIDHVILLSGSPVWLSTVIITTNPINFVSFDAEFTSSVGAQGVLAIMWNTNKIGTLDERSIKPGLQHYRFAFPNASAYSPYVLGLRLDPFTNIQSVVTLANIVFNQAGVSQPFSLSITTNTVNNLRVWRMDGEKGFNYNIQTSTNLNSYEWTEIAILENTNSTVFFYDTNQNIYNQRFYRAVAP